MSFGTILTSLQGGHFDEPTGRSRTGWRGCRSQRMTILISLRSTWTLRPGWTMEGLYEANEDRNFRGLDCCHNFMYYLEYLKFLLAE